MYILYHNFRETPNCW